MTARNLLVLLLEDGHESQLRDVLAKRSGETPSVRLVAPAHVSAVEWLATDEDDARIEAETRVLAAEWALHGDGDVGGEAGEADPVLAVEDALRTFQADEILVVGGASRNGGFERSLRKLGLPVTRVPAGERARGRRPLREAMRALRRGENRATPFVLFAGVNLALLALAALISAVVLVVLLLLR